VGLHADLLRCSITCKSFNKWVYSSARLCSAATKRPRDASCHRIYC